MSTETRLKAEKERREMRWLVFILVMAFTLYVAVDLLGNSGPDSVVDPCAEEVM